VQSVQASLRLRDTWMCVEVVIAAASTGLPPDLKAGGLPLRGWPGQRRGRQGPY
jgi:hypothetical protein